MNDLRLLVIRVPDDHDILLVRKDFYEDTEGVDDFNDFNEILLSVYTWASTEYHTKYLEIASESCEDLGISIEEYHCCFLDDDFDPDMIDIDEFLDETRDNIDKFYNETDVSEEWQKEPKKVTDLMLDVAELKWAIEQSIARWLHNQGFKYSQILRSYDFNLTEEVTISVVIDSERSSVKIIVPNFFPEEDDDDYPLYVYNEFFYRNGYDNIVKWLEEDLLSATRKILLNENGKGVLKLAS